MVATWAAAMKKDSAHTPTKETPWPASLCEGPPKTATMPVSGGEHTHPSPVFVKVGKKLFEVPACYGGSLKDHQEVSNGKHRKKTMVCSLAEATN